VTVQTLAFAAVAVVLLASSLGVVLTPNLFHAILYLAVALVATGVVFLLLDAPFLFGVQLLLYAGGVVTIVVFAIMLTERLVGVSIRQSSRYLINGALLSAAIFVGVMGFVVQLPPAGEAAWPTDLTAAVGRALVGPYAVPLELLGALLVIALLGALYFARSEP
jgi:NADH:ubiquinone oxidoreductase subunit 6 (subunit J)